MDDFEQVEICLDSGANCQSANKVTVAVSELGFESLLDWDAASDDEKLQAVQEFFHQDGYPEWSWCEIK